MIFLSPAAIRKKRKLFQQSQRGTLTQEQFFQRALEIDPFDSIALTGLGADYLKKGDIEAALRYFWRSLEADPTDYQAYLHLVGLYGLSDLEVEHSLSYLALRRALRSPGRMQPEAEKLVTGIRANIRQSSPGLDDDTFHGLAMALALSRPNEPERVAMLLLPYRLIQVVLDRPVEAMSRDWVDRIVALGAPCVPLLVGVVRGWARDDEGEGSTSAAAALALLGEIGEHAAMPAIAECMDADDPAVRVAAVWAGDRMLKGSASDTTVYDLCCAPPQGVDSEDEAAAREAGVAQDKRISRMLLDFLKDNVKTSEMQDALKMFFGHAPMAELVDTDQMAFFDWLLNDYTPRNFRRTIPQEYLVRHGDQLTRQDRKAVREWTSSYSSLFEVQSVKKGVGVELQDLLLDRRLFVHDITSSNGARWDCVFSRVRPEGHRMVFTAVGMRITPDVCDELRDWIAVDWKASGWDWLPYLRAFSHHIRQHCVDIYDQKRKDMRFATAEGDELVFSKAAYRVLNRERVLEALEGEELIGDRQDEDGTVRFTWFETATMTDNGRRALGSLCLDGERLVLECMSRQRLKRGIALLHKLAGLALEEKLTEFQSPQAAMRNMPQPGPERAPLEGESQLMSELKERHFRSWPDINLPALDGRTPREAARDAAVRPRLIGLLKSIENSEEHERVVGKAWFDVSRLKSELGVDY